MTRSQERLRRRFLRFAERECPGLSPLYAALARAAAADEEIITLAARVPPGQPPPNLLLAAVHALLLAGTPHPLRDCYPDLVDVPRPAEEAPALFRDFCRRHATAIAAQVRTRRVSTNETARAACIYPALLSLAAAHPGRPLHLVDIGASAGLNLLLDRFGFDYGAAGRRGAVLPALTLRCALRGRRPPLALPRLPGGQRFGIDLQPMDVRRADDTAWLQALIWPEQHARAARLRQAIAIARRRPPKVRSGDALRVLPRVLAALPAGEPVCVLHAFTLNQFDAGARRRLQARLYAGARTRPLYRLGYEWGRGAAPQLQVAAYGPGRDARPMLLADACAHGSWLHWRAPADRRLACSVD